MLLLLESIINKRLSRKSLTEHMVRLAYKLFEIIETLTMMP